MTARRGTSGLAGILAIDKPAGMTSHDVVAAVRQATGEGRVGHAGTLDPLATGLLVVLVGPATRLAPYLIAANKRYEARIVFGEQMDTDDAAGAVVESVPVPPQVLDPDRARAALASGVGEFEQVPPAYSAVKLQGRKAYEIARAGGEPEMASRRVELLEAALMAVDPGPPPLWDVRLTVSKGFYVRSFARDLGRELGTAAHLGGLRRLASGAVTLDDAHPLEAVTTSDPASIPTLFADPVAALGLGELPVDDATAALVANGGAIPAPEGLVVAPAQERVTPGSPRPARPLAITHCGTLLAVYRPAEDGASLRPAVVIPGGVRGGES